MDVLRTIGNLFWLFLAGWANALAYAFAGVIMFILIITIPFGIAAFRLANYSIWPFGRVVVPDPTAGAASTVGNVLWFVLAGWWLALAQLAVGIAYCLTIIGIPFGIANFKLARLSINPLGKKVVPAEFADVFRA